MSFHPKKQSELEGSLFNRVPGGTVNHPTVVV